jgi:U3 small nucleolar RNA-associated protein 24
MKSERYMAVQIDLVAGMMDCLYAECVPCITDCVLAELEKLGQKYRVALKVAKVCSCTIAVV